MDIDFLQVHKTVWYMEFTSQIINLALFCNTTNLGWVWYNPLPWIFYVKLLTFLDLILTLVLQWGGVTVTPFRFFLGSTKTQNDYAKSF